MNPVAFFVMSALPFIIAALYYEVSMQTFTSNEFNFSFDYDDHVWDVVINEPDSTMLLVSIMSRVKKYSFTITANRFDTPRPLDSTQAVSSFIETYASIGLTVTRVALTSFRGKKAVEIHGVTGRAKERIEYAAWIIIDESLEYLITCASESGKGEKPSEKRWLLEKFTFLR
ncbi:MAG: hypothetical protein JW795_20965 [Chitinivibrionales bacterium]|nr:hypothetical protein [Chitinivibrionales bacterium]